MNTVRNGCLTDSSRGLTGAGRTRIAPTGASSLAVIFFQERAYFWIRKLTDASRLAVRLFHEKLSFSSRIRSITNVS